MMKNKHNTIGSNFYEKLETFKYIGSLLKNKKITYTEENLEEAELLFLFNLKHFWILDSSPRILK